MISVDVASMNPVKIQAVKNVLNERYQDIEVNGYKVNSMVSNKPLGYEIVEGALNRAKLLSKQSFADAQIGLESGFLEYAGNYYLVDVCVIIEPVLFGIFDLSVANGPLYRIGKNIYECAKNNLSLHDIIISNLIRENTKTQYSKEDGIIGFLTSGKITRRGCFEKALCNALDDDYLMFVSDFNFKADKIIDLTINNEKFKRLDQWCENALKQYMDNKESQPSI